MCARPPRRSTCRYVCLGIPTSPATSCFSHPQVVVASLVPSKYQASIGPKMLTLSNNYRHCCWHPMTHFLLPWLPWPPTEVERQCSRSRAVNAAPHVRPGSEPLYCADRPVAVARPSRFSPLPTAGQPAERYFWLVGNDQRGCPVALQSSG